MNANRMQPVPLDWCVSHAHGAKDKGHTRASEPCRVAMIRLACTHPCWRRIFLAVFVVRDK